MLFTSTSFGALVLLQSCQRTAHETSSGAEHRAFSYFEDATEKFGVRFVHDAGGAEKYFMPASVGSGLAFLDFNNDGRLDLFFVQNGGTESESRNALFRQESDGRFTDVSAGSGLDVAGRGMGVAVGDVNNDGWSDVAVTEYNAIRLFLNQTNGTFREVTKEAGLDDPFWAISASFFDYDRDGWLDLVVANYVAYDPQRPCFDETGQSEFCGPKTFPGGTATKLFHNRGAIPGPRFEDVTIPSGLGSATSPALGVVCLDFNGDQWSDIFIASDSEPNRLWINQRDGTFKDEAVTRGLAFNGMGKAQGNMGIAVADVDGNGALDIFVTHLVEEMHALWYQSPRGLFQDQTARSGMAQPLWHGTGFGTVAADFDNDGAADIAIANGGVRRNKLYTPDARTIAALGPFWARYAERNQLFLNDGIGRFRDASDENETFCGDARGLICGDIDNDGGVDLVVSNIAAAAHIYRNVGARRGHWLSVRAVEPGSGGRDSYGAEISVESRGRRLINWIIPGSSYASSNDPRAHFGLGAVQAVDAISVLWPDGATERFSGGEVDRLIVLRKGDGKITNDESPPK